MTSFIDKKHLKFKQGIRSSTTVMGIRMMMMMMMMMMILTILLIMPLIMAKGNYDPHTHSSSSSSSSSSLDDDRHIQPQYFHGDDVDAISNSEKLKKKIKKNARKNAKNISVLGQKHMRKCIEGCAHPEIEQIKKKCEEECSRYGYETRDYHRCVVECWISSLFEFSVQS